MHPTLKGLVYLQDATGWNKVKQKAEAKEETKNKNTKSDNQKGTTEPLHQRTATRNCRVYLLSSRRAKVKE